MHTNILSIINQWYPRANPAADAIKEWFDSIKKETGLSPEKVMLAASICSDDINSIEYPDEARKALGPFQLGGLAGFPFTGLTGMHAFVQHVPRDGALGIFFGPHIGISKDGELGRIYRTGQTTSTDCCGATITAIKKLTAGATQQNEITDLDYQQNKIEQMLGEHENVIITSQPPLKEATEMLYRATAARIQLLISKTKFPCRYIFLYGCIVINADYNYGAFYELRLQQMIDLQTAQLKSC